MSRPNSESSSAPAPLRRRLLLTLAATLSGFLGSASSVLAAVQKKPKSGKGAGKPKLINATTTTDHGLDPNDSQIGQHIPIDIILFPPDFSPSLFQALRQRRLTPTTTTRYVGLVFGYVGAEEVWKVNVYGWKQKDQSGPSGTDEHFVALSGLNAVEVRQQYLQPHALGDHILVALDVFNDVDRTLRVAVDLPFPEPGRSVTAENIVVPQRTA